MQDWFFGRWITRLWCDSRPFLSVETRHPPDVLIEGFNIRSLARELENLQKLGDEVVSRTPVLGRAKQSHDTDPSLETDADLPCHFKIRILLPGCGDDLLKELRHVTTTGDDSTFDLRMERLRQKTDNLQSFDGHSAVGCS